MTPDSTVPSDTDRLAEIQKRLDAFHLHAGRPPWDEHVSRNRDALERNAPGDLAFLLGELDDAQRLFDALGSEAAEELKAAHATLASLQGRLDTAEGQLAKWKEIHKPEKRYTPDDGETSYAEYSEAADASFDGVGTARSVTFFEICSHCASLELGDGFALDYRESLWPCKDAEAAGLGEGDGQ